MTQYVLLLFGLIGLCPAIAQSNTEANFLNSSDGLAVDGYDVVAYFADSKAVEGKREIFSIHNGVRYRFSTIKNKQTFEKNPSQFLPQYGGWCAYAMGATGEKVDVDPETFKIKAGKLYLFYNRFFNNTLTKWNTNEVVFESQANKNWRKITSKSESVNQVP